MKFGIFQTTREWLIQNGSVPRHINERDFYSKMIPVMGQQGVDASTEVEHLKTEMRWINETKPYYKVYPSIINSLLQLKLHVPVESLSLPVDTIAIRLPEVRHELECNSILLSLHDVPKKLGLGKGWRQLRWIFKDESGYRRPGIILRPGETVEQAIDPGIHPPQTTVLDSDTGVVHTIKRNGSLPTAVIKADLMKLRLCVAIALLSNDPGLVIPEVLNADQDKYAATGDLKYVEKAKRRGVVGWSVGRDIESCPHYRRPHLAIRHTGPGRTVPRIVPVKGSVVHREKVTQVPTGYILPNGREVE